MGQVLADREILATLRGSALFESASDDELTVLAHLSRVERVAADAVVLSVGEESDDLFVVIDGEFLAYAHNEAGDEVALRRISGQGRFFGEIAFLAMPRAPRTASVRAITDSRLLRIPGATFEDWLRRDRALEQRLRTLAADQIRASAMQQLPLLRSLLTEGTASVLSERTYSEGETVCRQGEAGREMYVILSGTARVFRTDSDGSIVQLVRLLPGQSFGELSLIEGTPRTANVVAESTLHVLAIDAEDFLRAYQADPAVRAQFAALRGVYDYGHRGVAVRFVGTLSERPAMCTLFRLDDGRRIVTHKVIDHDIWSIQYTEVATDAVQVAFSDPERLVERTLLVRGDLLIGAVVKGSWTQLPQVHAFVLEQVPFASPQLEAFRRTGELEDPRHLTAPVADPIVCECMRVRRGALLQAIAAGCTTLEALSERTGAGTVCGSCQPMLAQLTNEQLWQSVPILQVIERTAQVRSFRFPIPDAHAGKKLQPGQHVIVQAPIGGVEVQRTYTLSSSALERSFYEITVKHEPAGVMSTWLFEHARTGARLTILPPSGWCFFDLTESRPLVCFVAGIGVTPALSIVRSARAADASRRIHVDYSASERDEIVCAEELAALTKDSQRSTLRLRVTREEGRLTGADIKDLAASFNDADFLVCGSKPYQIDVQGQLQQLAIPEHRIHVESFDAVGLGSPRVTSEAAARPDRRRERAAVALLLGLVAFVGQDLLNWRWPILAQLQSVTTWSAATGVALLAVYLVQWRLPYLRLTGRLRETARAYNLHIWLGPAMLGLMLLHTTAVGYRLSFVLSLCFIGSLATGALIGAVERSRSSGKVRSVVFGLHILQSCAVLGLAATHGLMSLWY